MKHFILLLFLSVPMMFYAQTVTIEGHIADKLTGQSLPMATVKLSSGAHTISNEYGAFKITADASDHLVFSYLGYRSKTVPAAQASGIIKLEPLETNLQEVTVMSTDKRIETIIKTARDQLSDNRTAQSTFFYRQLSLINNQPSSLTEAFIQARSAMLIRNLELITGRYSTQHNGESYQTYAGDFIVFSQMGMLLTRRNEPEWEDIVPLSSNYKSYYNVTLDIVGDCYVLRFKPKENYLRPIVDCTLFVDINSMHLRKAVGSFHQLKIRHHAGTPMEYSLPIRLRFTCLYNSDRGFCEVQSVTTNIQYNTDDADYAFQSIIYNVGSETIKNATPMGRVTDLREQIAKVPFVRSFWDEHETVKRTPIEMSLDAGTPAAVVQLQKWVGNMERFNQLFPQEKVYVHLDNSGYFMGETIWMKAYVVRADNHSSTNLSRVLYVDLVSPSGDVVATRKLNITNGEAEGSIDLKGLIGSGFYEVRAYTRYMLNWDSQSVFSRIIPIFKEPRKEGDYSHAVIDKSDYRRQQPNHREQGDTHHSSGKIQVRFYPEGGHLVTQRESKVAFEVFDDKGKAIKVEGRLMVGDHVVCQVRSGDNGRGVFSVKPTEEPAVLIIVDDKGREKTFALPEAMTSGAILSVDAVQGDRISVSVSTSADLNGVPLGLALMNGGYVNAFTTVTTIDDGYKTAFRRSELDEGVNRLLLFSQDGKILSDRMFFIYPHESVDSIMFSALSPHLKPSQKTTLIAKTRPNSRFSVSIHDHDTEVNGRLQNVDSWLLLSSELRGYIENADYYLESDDVQHREATDLLMMIQGWHRYNVSQMMTQRKLDKQQPIEDHLTLIGQVKGMRKRSSAVAVNDVRLQATLYNRAGQVLRGDTRTDSLGHFLFTVPDCEGPWRMSLRTTKDDKPADYYISIDRQPAFTARQLDYYEQQPSPLAPLPLECISASANFDDEIPMELRNHLLSEVVVKGKNRRIYGAWDDENLGAHKAILYYDCQKAIEDYADKGLPQPNLFEFLKDRNEFFGGDNGNVFDDAYGWYVAEAKTEEEYDLYKKYSTAVQQSGHRDDLVVVYKERAGKDMPECSDEYCSEIQDISIGANYVGALVNHPAYRNILLPHTGLSYNQRPVIWVLNNVFFAVTQTSSAFKPIDIEWMSPYSLENMPEQLEDVKSVYVSDDDLVWQRFIRSSRLGIYHPITVFVYSDTTPSAQEKGVRNTYFEGFSVDTYDMPGYAELPPISDFRRTLYWNPSVVADAEGKATIEFFNSSTCRRINVSAEGITPDGHVVVYK